MVKFITDRLRQNMFWERVRYAFLTRVSLTKPINVALWVAGVLSSFITIFGSEEGRPSKECLFLILFLSAIGGLIYVICTRWIKLKVYIPPNRKEAREYAGKVMLNMTDILAPFEKEEGKHYDIALVYNINNLAGGRRMGDNVNLFGQFLIKYFKGAKTNGGLISFDFDLFRSCMQNELSRAFRIGKENDETVIVEYPKEMYADSLYNAQVNIEEGEIPEKVFPWRSGTVIALKLPEGSDRDYAYLMCSTRYEGSLKPLSDETEQLLCLECLWKIVKKLHRSALSDRVISIPFINKGYSELKQKINYSVLWNILHSYKMATVDLRNKGKDVDDKFALDIHITRDVLKINELNMAEVLRFLKFALLG